MNMEFRNPEDNAWMEPSNQNADQADLNHVQNVMNRHAAGKLVTVLTCNEEIDGATWTVLARNNEGDLVNLDICDEPGYSHIETTANYTEGNTR